MTPPVLSIAMTAAVALVNMREIVEAIEDEEKASGSHNPERALNLAWLRIRRRYH
jgi:hypothetical protein